MIAATATRSLANRRGVTAAAISAGPRHLLSGRPPGGNKPLGADSCYCLSPKRRCCNVSSETQEDCKLGVSTTIDEKHSIRPLLIIPSWLVSFFVVGMQPCMGLSKSRNERRCSSSSFASSVRHGQVDLRTDLCYCVLIAPTIGFRPGCTNLFRYAFSPAAYIA